MMFIDENADQADRRRRMSDLSAVPPAGVRDAATAMGEASRYWWILLVTGIAWLLFSIIVFRFNWASVSSISILFGCVLIAAGISELALIAGASRGWKIARGLLGAAFVVIGIIAFIHPGNTFKALAAVISFYFVFKGTFDVIVALTSRDEELWWLHLVLGIVELLLGFWAAGDFGRKTVLLLVWVGAAALIRGFSQIIAAFSLRSLRNANA
jgi:uncharacterized membrane protein HdeD (DUF308 family)